MENNAAELEFTPLAGDCAPLRKCVLVTGTGTGVGKTASMAYIYPGLVLGHFFAGGEAASFPCLALKPLQTGVSGKHRDGGVLPSLEEVEDGDDIGLIYKACQYFLNYAGVEISEFPFLMDCFFAARRRQVRFGAPCSPHLAAKLNERPSFEDEVNADFLSKLCWERGADGLGNNNLPTIIEGAGGLFVPINQKSTFADFAAKFGVPTILVSSGGLGEIHNLLSTIKAGTSSGVNIAGFVFSDALGLLDNDCLCKEAGGHLRHNGARINIDISKNSLGGLAVSLLVDDNAVDVPVFTNCVAGGKIEVLDSKNSYSPLFGQGGVDALCGNCFKRLIMYDNLQTVVALGGVPFLGFIPKMLNVQGMPIGGVGSANYPFVEKEPFSRLDFNYIRRLLGVC